MSAEGWVLIIAAVFIGIVNIINAFGVHWGRREAQAAAVEARIERHEASDKLDVIHELTNSNMTALKAQLAASLDRIARLEQLLEKRAP